MEQPLSKSEVDRVNVQNLSGFDPQRLGSSVLIFIVLVLTGLVREYSLFIGWGGPSDHTTLSQPLHLGCIFVMQSNIGCYQVILQLGYFLVASQPHPNFSLVVI